MVYSYLGWVGEQLFRPCRLRSTETKTGNSSLAKLLEGNGSTLLPDPGVVTSGQGRAICLLSVSLRCRPPWVYSAENQCVFLQIENGNRDRETARFVKCLPCNHEHPSVIPSTHVKRIGVLASACDPSIAKVEAGRFLEPSGQPSLARETSCLNKNKMYNT